MKRTGRKRVNLWGRLAIAACLGVAQSAFGGVVSWVDWTSANATSATGTAAGITVGFTGAINPPAQTAGGTNYWAVNASIYTDPGNVDNPPPDSDIIRLIGGTAAGTQTLTFSSPVTNPVMAILSLGQPSVQVDYLFDTPFDVLNQGVGFWGGVSLTEEAGNVLRGFEGHGLIQFQGTVSSISWTVPLPENWHGFQVGILSTAVPEPATLALLGLALAGFGFARRRKST